MGEVCPHVGLIYRDRLLRLPRRLGFEASSEALEGSRVGLEADLTEYAEAAKAWLDGESDHARQLLIHVAGISERINQSGDLHTWMLDNLAEQMEASAAVDDAEGVRASLARYAVGLRSYAGKKKKEDLALLADLEHEAKRLQSWLARGNVSNSIDPLTGLLTRGEAEKLIETRLKRDRTFCVLRFDWAEAGTVPENFGRAGGDQIIKKLGDRLTSLVRPRDVVFRWSESQLAVIFECSAKQAKSRSDRISEWLSDSYTAVVDGLVWKVDAHIAVTVIERIPGEPLGSFTSRIDA